MVESLSRRHAQRKAQIPNQQLMCQRQSEVLFMTLFFTT